MCIMVVNLDLHKEYSHTSLGQGWESLSQGWIVCVTLSKKYSASLVDSFAESGRTKLKQCQRKRVVYVFNQSNPSCRKTASSMSFAQTKFHEDDYNTQINQCVFWWSESLICPVLVKLTVCHILILKYVYKDYDFCIMMNWHDLKFDSFALGKSEWIISSNTCMTEVAYREHH